MVLDWIFLKTIQQFLGSVVRVLVTMPPQFFNIEQSQGRQLQHLILLDNMSLNMIHYQDKGLLMGG